MEKKNKINELLKELFALSKKMSFADLKLKDGTMLRTTSDTFEKGAPVVLVSTEGVESPATDGDFTVEDGSKITIKGGVVEVAAVAEGEKKDETKMEAPTAPASTSNVPAPAEKKEKMEGELEVEQEIDPAMLMETIKNLIERVAALEESTSTTSMAVEQMSAQPAAAPFVADPHGDFKFKPGTIGYELEKFKAEKKAKNKANQEAMLKFNAEVAAKNAAKENKTTTNKTESFSGVPNKFFDLGMNGGFSVESGK